ncbi:hypothetical protein MXB_4969, partial [Myxobolus squamalis]
MKSSLIFIIIDLIIFGNSFGASNYQLKKNTKSLKIETYHFKESDNFKQDFIEIIHSCTNCRVIVDNKFLYFKHQLKTTKIQKNSKLYCATDRLFNENSMHACSWDSEAIFYENSSRITIDLTITNQAFINISFLNLNNNISETDYGFLKGYLSLGLYSIYSFVKLDIKGAQINNKAKYNLELTKTNVSHMYYPFNPIKLGFSFLNHQLCRIKLKSNILQCQYPCTQALYMMYFDVNWYMRTARLFDVTVSGIFFCCFLFLLIKCIIFLSSSEICKHIQKKFFHISITLYSSFFAFVLCIDILLKYILPIFLLYILCYTCLSIFSGLSIYVLFIKKIHVYRFKNYTFTPDVIGLLHLLLYSFVCVIELALSIFFYVLSSKQIWCWESSVFLFISALLFIAYVVSLSFGFNYTLSKFIYDAILRIFDTTYIPFSMLTERPPSYPINASKTMKSDEIQNFINNFTYENDDKPPLDDKTNLYYESFIDLVPVFLIQDDDLSVTFPASSSDKSESTINHTPEIILPSTNDSVFSSINNTIVDLQPFKVSHPAESLYSTPDMSSKLHKQYPRTPFKVMCPNINPFLDEVVLKLDFDD